MSRLKYRCENCGAVFTNPMEHTWREDMNGEGAWCVFLERLCPECGCDAIEEYLEEEE